MFAQTGFLSWVSLFFRWLMNSRGFLSDSQFNLRRPYGTLRLTAQGTRPTAVHRDQPTNRTAKMSTDSSEATVRALPTTSAVASTLTATAAPSAPPTSEPQLPANRKPKQRRACSSTPDGFRRRKCRSQTRAAHKARATGDLCGAPTKTNPGRKPAGAI